VRLRGLAALLAVASFASVRCPAFATAPSVAALDAVARAEGNRRPEAVTIGRSIFARTWAAQVMNVRVDGTGSHTVAGLTLSAVKFHQSLDLTSFQAEIAALAGLAFAAAPVEEVDVQATEPLRVGIRAVVSGDLAMPTARIVYAVTIRRTRAGRLGEALAAGAGVFVAPDFRRRLGGPER